MTHEPAELRRLTNEELVDLYRRWRAEAGGAEAGVTSVEDVPDDAIREEMQRRGLVPDREDLIPDADPDGETVVDDRA
ncbi:MAG: hypothetical protein WAL25_03925 [Acidimicrobiia bacterium]